MQCRETGVSYQTAAMVAILQQVFMHKTVLGQQPRVTCRN